MDWLEVAGMIENHRIEFADDLTEVADELIAVDQIADCLFDDLGQIGDECLELLLGECACRAGAETFRCVALEPESRRAPLLGVFGGLLQLAQVHQFGSGFGIADFAGKGRVAAHSLVKLFERRAGEAGGHLAVAAAGEKRAHMLLLLGAEWGRKWIAVHRVGWEESVEDGVSGSSPSGTDELERHDGPACGTVIVSKLLVGRGPGASFADADGLPQRRAAAMADQ